MRDNSVSISKAFAIILMVIAHSGFFDFGNRWIAMFHMPLFFFMSGYCFKDKYLTDLKMFAIKRFSGLYRPFVKWSLLFLVLHNVFFYLNIYNSEYGFRGNVSQLYSLTDFAKRAIMIVTSMSGNEQLLGGYWFLKSLFVASFLAYFFIKYVKNPVVRGGYLLVITILMSAFNLSMPYFNISSREFLATLIFTIGYSYKSRNLKLHQSWCCVPIGLLLVTLGAFLWQTSLTKFNWMQVVPYLISAIAGSLMVFKFSTWLNGFNGYVKKILLYIGDNTLTILTWHFFSFKIISLIIIYLEDLPIKRLAEFPILYGYGCNGCFVFYLLAGLLVPLIFKSIITRYFLNNE